MLLDLPIAGATASPLDTPADWHDDLLGRFEGILPVEAAAAYYVFPT